MYRPSRARRMLKWTGVSLVVILVAGWVFSGWNAFGVLPTQGCHFSINRGAFVVALSSNFDLSYMSNGYLALPSRDLGFHGPDFAYEVTQTPRGTLKLAIARIPFWFLLLLTAVPTAWLWHRDRRRIPPGCCLRCGYDLTGNTSGVCSECGNKFRKATGEIAA